MTSQVTQGAGAPMIPSPPQGYTLRCWLHMFTRSAECCIRCNSAHFGEVVPGVPQIMEMQAFGADRPHRVRPGRHPVEVASSQRATHHAGKDQRPRLVLGEDRQVLAQYRHDRLGDAHDATASPGLRRPEQNFSGRALDRGGACGAAGRLPRRALPLGGPPGARRAMLLWRQHRSLRLVRPGTHARVGPACHRRPGASICLVLVRVPHPLLIVPAGDGPVNPS